MLSTCLLQCRWSWCWTPDWLCRQIGSERLKGVPLGPTSFCVADLRSLPRSLQSVFARQLKSTSFCHAQSWLSHRLIFPIPLSLQTARLCPSIPRNFVLPTARRIAAKFAFASSSSDHNKLRLTEKARGIVPQTLKWLLRQNPHPFRHGVAQWPVLPGQYLRTRWCTLSICSLLPPPFHS